MTRLPIGTRVLVKVWHALGTVIAHDSFEAHEIKFDAPDRLPCANSEWFHPDGLEVIRHEPL